VAMEPLNLGVTTPVNPNGPQIEPVTMVTPGNMDTPPPPGPREAPPPDPNEQWIPAWNPDNELVEVPASGMQGWGAKLAGYRPATPEEVQKYRLEQKYGTPGQMVATAGEAALGTLLPGVGPYVEQKLGVPAKETALRAQVNPGMHALGTAGAIGLSAAAAPLLGAAAGAPALITEIGEGTADAIGAGSALARITSAAVNMGTQGALWSTGDVLNRAVLQEAPLTAEQVLSEIGVGTLLSGGLGAVGGGVKAIGKGLGVDFTQAINWLETRSGIKAAGAIGRTMKRAEKQMGMDRLGKIMQFLGDEGTFVPGRSFQTMQNIAREGMQDAGSGMQDLLTRAGAANVPGGGMMGARPLTILDVNRAIRNSEQYKDLAENFLQTDALNKVEEGLRGAERQFSFQNPDGTLGYQTLSPDDLHTISQRYADAARGYEKSMDPQRSALSDTLDAARWQTNKILDDQLDKIGAGAGVSSRAWQDLKFRYQAYKTLDDFTAEGIFRSGGNNRASLVEVMGGLAGFVHGGVGAGMLVGAGTTLLRREGAAVENVIWRNLRRFVQSTGQKNLSAIGQATKRMFQGAVGEASAALGSAAANYEPVTPENYQSQAQQWNEYGSDPEKIAQVVEKKLGPLIASAPPVALALHQAASKQMAYLAGQAPQYQKVGPLDPDYEPSWTELAQMNERLEVAHNPTAILDRITNGSLTQDYVNHVQAMWPAQLIQMRKIVSDQMAAAIGKKEHIPYQTRLGLAMFLGMPLDRFTTPQASFASQMAYASQPAPTPVNVPKSSTEKARNVTIAASNRMATATQQADERLEKA